MRTCPECKASVDDASRFCENCGYPMSDLPASDASVSTSGTNLPSSPGTGSGPDSHPILDNPAVPSRPTSWGGKEGGSEASPGACSACGFINLPGEMFCQNCGVQLPPVTSLPPPPPRPNTEAQVDKREMFSTIRAWHGTAIYPTCTRRTTGCYPAIVVNACWPGGCATANSRIW